MLHKIHVTSINVRLINNVIKEICVTLLGRYDIG